MKQAFIILGLCLLASAQLLHSKSERLKSYPDEDVQTAAKKVMNQFRYEAMTGTTDDSVSLLGYTGKAGMIPISEPGSSMFYWQIDKKGDTIDQDQYPLILWLQGGPGCSSQAGNFFEFGPYYVNSTGQINNREITWANDYHLLFIDNPIGAGFSFAANRNEYVTT
jgi:carboxypeptidase C (cathepsin A)